jgi:hypothetical protein
MKLGDKYKIQLNDWGDKKVFLLETITQRMHEVDLTFREVEKGRTHYTAEYRKKNGKWYRYRPPFTLDHDPPPEFYMESGTWEEVEAPYIPVRYKRYEQA